ncbi:hypothetical protein HU200_045365 [Digitaria exilis]|uniref:UDP-glycosyltransferases domain-containing protein n=1 Tax=Digitaria exilis TaxID=1010633 RepID=A0A835EER4_9POAL|nr:hypothetical protein HU200_045365 [Digitaria exilis]
MATSVLNEVDEKVIVVEAAAPVPSLPPSSSLLPLAMDAADDSTMHIVIFPWLAFGHLLPCLELAERLAARGHRVSFVSTPRNLARLPPVRTPALARLVDLVALPLPQLDGLPDGAEATSDVPYDKFELHRNAFDALAAPFASFLDAACDGSSSNSRRPDWVVADFIHHWVADAAEERNVPCAMLLPCAAGIAASAGKPGDPSSHAEQRQAIAQAMSGATAFETQQAAEAFATEGVSLGPSLISRFVQTLTRCRFVAVRSCPELEPDAFRLLTRLYGKPAVPLGMLPPRPDGTRGVSSKDAEDDDVAITRWLDAQPGRSVVYVALGTEAPVRVELLRELAHGLELAGTRFLWALRPPIGADEDSIIPSGFAERVGDRGIVTTRWVPQVRVLAHGAVCAFLTHCGWGSIVEGLQHGLPLIMLPIFGDQGPNARLMEGRRVGVVVPRDEKDGSFDRDGVAGAVRAVVVEEEGRAFANNARRMQEIVADRECSESVSPKKEPPIIQRQRLQPLKRRGHVEASQPDTASDEYDEPASCSSREDESSSRLNIKWPSRAGCTEKGLQPCCMNLFSRNGLAGPLVSSNFWIRFRLPRGTVVAVIPGPRRATAPRPTTNTPAGLSSAAMDTTADTSESPLHVVIFPWLAFGHLLPALELAKRLASRGHRVSFVSTPRNISRLPQVPPALAPLIGFVALPLPRVDGLPDGAEATSDVPPGKADLHTKAFDGLAAPFSSFLDADGDKIDWLVLDSFHYWAAAAAEGRNIPCVLYLVFSAETLSRYGVPRGVSAAAVGDLGAAPSIAQRFVLTFEVCKLVANRTYHELEPETVPLLPGIFGKPVIPVGLLPPPPSSREGHNDTATSAAALMTWLDKQPPSSVLYAAFESEAPVTVEQLHEVAHGLELAGTGFLWALKKPSGGGGGLESEGGGLLPPGFEERARGRGLVTMGWVPQLGILAHGAVGAFLTHCGWSSTVEGLLYGQPLVMLPFLGEQEINAQLMERKQVGVQVPRHGDDRSFDREGVASSVRAVMSGEEGGRVFAANAKKLREIVTDENCQGRWSPSERRLITGNGYKHRGNQRDVDAPKLPGISDKTGIPHSKEASSRFEEKEGSMTKIGIPSPGELGATFTLKPNN